MKPKFRAVTSGLLILAVSCNPVPQTLEPATPSPPIQAVSTISATLSETLPSPTILPIFTPKPIIGQVITTIPVGPMPGGLLTIGEGAVWVPNSGNSTLSRIDPQTNQVVMTIEIGERGGSYGSPLAVAVTPGAVWVTDNAGFAVVRIDPMTNELTARIPLKRRIAGVSRDVEPYYLSANNEAVWVTGLESDSIIRIDPQTNEVIAAFKLPSPSGVAIGENAV
jgi:DNA-binding beta-propeller fold protein YncE